MIIYLVFLSYYFSLDQIPISESIYNTLYNYLYSNELVIYTKINNLIKDMIFIIRWYKACQVVLFQWIFI